MTPRRRLELALFFLGWFLALGTLFRWVSTASLRVTLTRLRGSLESLERGASELEGRLVHRARGVARRDLLKKRFPALGDAAALRSPQRLLWGAFDGGLPQTMEGFAALERQLDTAFPLVAVYQAWGDRPEHHFPEALLSTIDKLGSVPVLTWEPWVVDFDPELRTHLPPPSRRELASLAAIARGDYDFHVVKWAEEAARWGRPLFIRFAHEMNDPYRYPWGPQNGNRAEDFVAAWRHVHLLFEKKGAKNVLWIWSPHPSMPWLEYYYPGNDVVDWVGLGALNYGTVASWSRWWSFDDIVGRAYPVVASFGKPVMLTEFASLERGGDPASWYAAARVSLEKGYPAVKGVILFNQSHDDTLGGGALDWSPLACSSCISVLRSWVNG